jgi:tetratricopeptide (TPR) repeat protein
MLVAIDQGRLDDLVQPTSAYVEQNIEQFPVVASIGVGLALDALEATGDVTGLLPIVDLVDSVPAGVRSRQLEADIARTRGVAASLAGDHDRAMDWFAKALSAARNLGELLIVAQVLAGYARALVRAGRADEAEPLAEEARQSFEQMGAVRAIERLDAAMPARVTA